MPKEKNRAELAEKAHKIKLEENKQIVDSKFQKSKII